MDEDHRVSPAPCVSDEAIRHAASNAIRLVDTAAAQGRRLADVSRDALDEYVTRHAR